MEANNVSSITSNTRTIRRYLTRLFDGQAGYVYVATKTLKKEFEQFFYTWPDQKEEIVSFISEQSSEKDVYIAPSLFTKPNSDKENWFGTYYVWAEFDTGTPKPEQLNEFNVPQPTIKIRTSTEGHEHWYWKLDQFVTDPNIIESITSRITYAFSADLSGWDCNQLLRPPRTKHHESKKQTELLIWNDSIVNPLVFNDLPPVPDNVGDIEIDTSKSVDVRDVMLKYPFKDKMRILFKSKISVGNRSEKLCELACFCFETGMSPTETLAILYNADERWGKFVGRKDREKRLIGIVKYARGRVAPVEDSEWGQWGGKLPIFGVMDFLKQDVKVEWVIDNFIPKSGIIVLAAPSGTGKTIETLQLCADMALGKQHLAWEITRPFKIVFLSMEFSLPMLFDRLQKMTNKDYTEEEQELLNNNFKVIPIGHGLNIANPKDQAVLLQMIEDEQPDGIMLDSLGASYSGDLKDESVRHIFEFLKRAITIKHDCFAWFIHHMKKDITGRPTIDDMYGSMYIKNYANAVIGMWKKNPEKNLVEIYSLKAWHSEPFTPFKVKVLLEPMRFEIIDPNESLIGQGFFNTEIGGTDSDDSFDL